MGRLWRYTVNALAIFGAAALASLAYFELSRRLWPEGL